MNIAESKVLKEESTVGVRNNSRVLLTRWLTVMVLEPLSLSSETLKSGLYTWLPWNLALRVVLNKHMRRPGKIGLIASRRHRNVTHITRVITRSRAVDNSRGV
jgi:hypothetical protein